MDSPDSRLDGNVELENAQLAASTTTLQQGQVFFKEVKVQEKKLEETAARLENKYLA